VAFFFVFVWMVEMRFHTLDEWLRWQESLHSSEIDMGLGRVREVASRMGLLKPSARVITVAGTNGKGSCVTSLQSLLNASGYRVASYTSPHLLRYNERIRLDGEPVDDACICAAFERIDQARQDPLEGDISLTYFEFGTLAAISVAAVEAVDYLVLEVGLGGRLDAVNILDADVAVVTSIALDHEAWLGADLTVIGREKAGVFRAGRPAICASADVPSSVRAWAEEIGAPYISAEEGLGWESEGETWSWSGLDQQGRPLSLANLPVPALPLPSVAAALQAFVCLGGDMGAKQRAALADLSLSGRAQRIERAGVSIVLDVGHNPAASEYLAERLAADEVEGKTYFVVAMMADKDMGAVLAPLLSLAQGVFLAELLGNTRAASVAQMQAALATCRTANRFDVAESGSVVDSLVAALNAACSGDRVVVTGSFFTVAEALSYLGLEV